MFLFSCFATGVAQLVRCAVLLGFSVAFLCRRVVFVFSCRCFPTSVGYLVPVTTRLVRKDGWSYTANSWAPPLYFCAGGLPLCFCADVFRRR